jgi:hypothetical protein
MLNRSAEITVLDETLEGVKEIVDMAMARGQKSRGSSVEELV